MNAHVYSCFLEGNWLSGGLFLPSWVPRKKQGLQGEYYKQLHKQEKDII